VTLNAAITLDGKIASAERRKFDLSSHEDRLRMGSLRDAAGVVIVGAGTLRTEDPPPFVRGQSRAPGAGGRPFTWIVLSRTLDVPVASRVLSSSEVRTIVVAPSGASNEATEPGLRRCAEIWSLGETEVDLAALLERLGGCGYRRVVVEGGGEVNFSFLHADLVDELCITLCPYVLGGAAAPTLADGRGFEAASPPRFRLVDVERVGEELFLRYDRGREK
jgi:riboflavin-specific deaminase-like protein